MSQYLSTVRVPLIALCLNAIIYQFIHIGFGHFGPILFNFIRIIVVIWAAWIIVERLGFTIVTASLVGPLFLFIDHVVLGGGLSLLTTDFSKMQFDKTDNLILENAEITYFVGICISYLMLFPVSMLFGLLGGYMSGSGSQSDAK